MAKHLVVTSGFAAYVKGERITDAELVAELLEKHPHDVVAITVADAAPVAPTEVKADVKAEAAVAVAPAAEVAPLH